ncbi:hypothetical protein DL072_26350, partial [Salmonella enterica subsp. enterica serovar Kokomlemle]|nr:hypothetical protein [Salmonella enterica subsp. enterica serovar Kokomlemle]
MIGSGVLNATTTEVLMLAGIENNTQISASGIPLGGSGDDWNQNYTSSKGGGWIFDGATVSKAGNISLQGVGFVNSSVTAGKDLTINNGDASLTVQNTTLNATAGNISLTGNAGLTLSGNSTVTAGKDITLKASAGGVAVTGQDSVGTVNITSTGGNISIEGNGTGVNRDGVLISNALLNASQGGITVTGVADGADYFTGIGGVRFSGSVNLISLLNTINGEHKDGSATENLGGVVINAGGSHFKGDTIINANSDRYAGLYLNGRGSDVNVYFSDGDSVINAINTEEAGNISYGGITVQAWDGNERNVNINVMNGTLNITGEAKTTEGINSFPGGATDQGANANSRYSGYVFTGDGDVNIKGVSDSGNGLAIRRFDNTGLTGNFTITGESNTGNGVAVPEFGNVSLVNATITGNSNTGTGILMNAGDE